MKEKCFLIGLLLIACMLPAQSQDIRLGAVDFPRAFIHAGAEYPGGYYDVVLTFRDAVPFFIVHDSKKELLFEELAIVMAQPGKRMSAAFRLKKEMTKGNEYFRIEVIRSGERLLGYFLVKN